MRRVQRSALHLLDIKHNTLCKFTSYCASSQLVNGAVCSSGLFTCVLTHTHTHGSFCKRHTPLWSASVQPLHSLVLSPYTDPQIPARLSPFPTACPPLSQQSPWCLSAVVLAPALRTAQWFRDQRSRSRIARLRTHSGLLTQHIQAVIRTGFHSLKYTLPVWGETDMRFIWSFEFSALCPLLWMLCIIMNQHAVRMKQCHRTWMSSSMLSVSRSEGLEAEEEVY